MENPRTRKPIVTISPPCKMYLKRESKIIINAKKIERHLAKTIEESHSTIPISPFIL
ncbi:hypothetical protein [Methanothermobacter tenebrarum]|uniref:hypothetical protein n=1 Tax=Methanothermobacter tenebrarum TaxID=680118 RepID=UPI0020C056D2|nr:hypothetical protein [Methanothermobacter tenebrarum]